MLLCVADQTYASTQDAKLVQDLRVAQAFNKTALFWQLYKLAPAWPTNQQPQGPLKHCLECTDGWKAVIRAHGVPSNEEAFSMLEIDDELDFLYEIHLWH